MDSKVSYNEAFLYKWNERIDVNKLIIVSIIFVINTVSYNTIKYYL